MRARTNIALKERSSLNIEFNRGVDLSSAPQKIASNRASYMRNMICDYGVTRKRNGWNEIYKFDDEINGIFEYSNEDHKVLIVHAGTKMYRCFVDADVKDDITGELELTSTRSQCFWGNKRLYIIGCGEYLVYGTWDDGTTYKLRAVKDTEDAYIPTTTISIGPSSDTTDKRAVKEAPNILIDKRKNQLSCAATDELDRYVLDAKVDLDQDIEIVQTFTKKESDGIYSFKEKHFVNTDKNKTQVNNSDVYEAQMYEVYEDGRVSTNPGASIRDTGELYIATDTNAVTVEDNTVVTFTAKLKEGSDELLNKRSAKKCIAQASIGTLFGAGGYSNRLFLAGSEESPNKIYYSEADDFTYFPDINYAYLGLDATAINGFCRLSDSTLAIFKEANKRESTIFFTEGQFIEKGTKSEYGMTIYDERFTFKAGAVGEGLVSSYGTSNFAGDHLMLSKNGLFGIVLGENIATQERYARERSRLINKELCKHDLSNAVGIVFDDKYYLAVDGMCYVADSRYKTALEDDIDSSFNYEWWVWDNIPARVFAVVGDDLWFGTPDGRICKFASEFTDRTYVSPPEGTLTIQTNDDDIAYSSDLSEYIIEGRKIVLSGDGGATDIYSYCGTAEEVIWVNDLEYGGYDTRVDIDSSKFKVGEAVFFEAIGGTAVTEQTAFVIKRINYNENYFVVAGMFVNTGTERNVNVYKKISERDLYIHVDPDVSNAFFVREHPQGENIVFSAYAGSEPTSLTARFEIANPIVAEWHTPYLDMGTNVFSKTLLKTTISAKNVQNGNLRFGYETRSELTNYDVKSQGLDSFSLFDLSFENFAFEKDFIRSYTRKFNERNFNYIKFHFISEGPADCALYDFTANYKINKANKGVR